MNKLQKKIAQMLGFSKLIDAADWQNRYQRPYSYPTVDAISKDVSLADWLLLVSDSRKLYWNLGPVTAAVDDKAMYAVGRAWDAKFCGSEENEEWGDLAEKWLNKNWYPVADVRGQGFNFKTDLHLLSTQTDVDGEVYVFLTESDAGWPQIQIIPATMIGQRDAAKTVESGPYAGMDIVQGIIYNSKGGAVAYRVLGDKKENDVDYSARDLIQVFDPKTSDQVRGFPVFTHALLDLSDLRLIQGNEKMVSAICSTIGIIEHNEMGAPDPNDPANFLRKGPVTLDGSSTLGPQMTTQTFQGISARYFRSGAGSKLEQLKLDRPGETWDKFMNRLIRNACAGAGWPYELCWDSSLLGGANVRLLLAKAERTVMDRQDLLRPVARRVVGYAIAKAIKLGLLPPCDEWYEWDFGMPARISVDYGRDGNSDREDYKLGITTMRDILEEEGKDLDTHYQELADQKAREDAAGTTNGESQRNRLDLIGVGVRAGIITPSPDVEAKIRELTGLPPMSSEVLQSWADSDGVRTPITLAQAAGAAQESVNGGAKVPSGGGSGDSDPTGA